MKKISYLFVLLVLISSCSLNKPTDNSLDNSTTPTSTPETSVADEVLDDYYLNESIKQNDSTKCDNIIDKVKNKECKEILLSLAIMIEAVEQLSDSKCDNITIERYRNSCKQDVESEKNKMEEEKNEESKRLMEAEEISRILEEANQKQDLSLCDNLSDKNQKDVCYYNVIVQESIKKQDSSVCEQLQNETYKQACKDNYEFSRS
ncbi:MAG: hypothetical protein RBS56_04495 [Candidatus Gracilibacteria bacterium]|jgi:hypothetical protein|nr:hypothetical protein [Candidatus Gracilibacteria bacterium]